MSDLAMFDLSRQTADALTEREGIVRSKREGIWIATRKMKRVLLTLLLFTHTALAERPHIEAEGVIVWDPNIHGGTGFGGGARLSIPFARSMRLGLPDELLLGVGADYVYFACPYTPLPSADCPDAHALFLPVTLAWSVGIHERLSIFIEPGVGTFIAFFRDGCPAEPCARYEHFGLKPLVTLGAAVHLGALSIVARAGFPAFSLGLSF